MSSEALVARPVLAGFDLGKYLPFRVSALSNHIARLIGRDCRARFKLSAPEWRVIAVLGQHGAMNTHAVIVETAMDKVRVSRSVAQLLRAGRISQKAEDLDRRRSILELTDQGRSIFERLVPLIQAIEANVLAEMSEAERRVFEGTLAKIESMLSRGGNDAAD